jgi:hypothetical protein
VFPHTIHPHSLPELAVGLYKIGLASAAADKASINCCNKSIAAATAQIADRSNDEPVPDTRVP